MKLIKSMEQDSFSISKKILLRQLYSPIRDLQTQWNLLEDLLREQFISLVEALKDPRGSQFEASPFISRQISIIDLKNNEPIKQLMKNCLYRNVSLIRGWNRMLKASQSRHNRQKLISQGDLDENIYESLIREKINEKQLIRTKIKKKSNNLLSLNIIEKIKNRTLESKQTQINNQHKGSFPGKFSTAVRTTGQKHRTKVSNSVAILDAVKKCRLFRPSTNSTKEKSSSQHNMRITLEPIINQHDRTNQQPEQENCSTESQRSEQKALQVQQAHISSSHSNFRAHFLSDGLSNDLNTFASKKMFDFMPKRPFRFNLKQKKDNQKETNQFSNRPLFEHLQPKPSSMHSNFINITKTRATQLPKALSHKNDSVSLFTVESLAQNYLKPKRQGKKLFKPTQSKQKKSLSDQHDLSWNKQIKDKIIVVKSFNQRDAQNIPQSDKIPLMKKSNTNPLYGAFYSLTRLKHRQSGKMGNLLRLANQGQFKQKKVKQNFRGDKILFENLVFD